MGQAVMETTCIRNFLLESCSASAVFSSFLRCHKHCERMHAQCSG